MPYRVDLEFKFSRLDLRRREGEVSLDKTGVSRVESFTVEPRRSTSLCFRGAVGTEGRKRVWGVG